MSSSAPRVLVTGVSGYLGGQVAAYLLATGFRVRGSVRSIKKDADKFSRLVGPERERVELCEANLSDSAGWAAAVRGCTYIQHVASPVPVGAVKNAQAEVVQPAIDGVTNVLRAAFAEPGVQRIVLMSSSAAINEGLPKEPGHVYTAADWTEADATGVTPYAKSKTLAERTAWRLVEEHRAAVRAGAVPGRSAAVELVVLNPGAILGSLATRTQTSSTQLVMKLVDGSMPGIPDLRLTAVDVRDVSNLAVRAMLVRGAAGGRFFAVGGQLNLRDAAPGLKSTLEPFGYRVPAARLPSWLLRIVALFDPAVKLVLPQLGVDPHFDASPTLVALGLPAWRPLAGVLPELAMSMVALGVLPAKTPLPVGGVDGEAFLNAASAVPEAEVAALRALRA